MPIFFDTSSIPIAERSPFQPAILRDDLPAPFFDESVSHPSEAIVDIGLPIPSHYNFDMIQALVQDPFRLYVYWRFANNPFNQLDKIFPSRELNGFYTALKLIDETSGISIFFDAGYTDRYWISVYPNRKYRIEVGLRSLRYGYIKLLSSRPVITPRGGPSEKVDTEHDYRIAHKEFLRILRDSHMIPMKRDYRELLAGLNIDEIPDDLRDFISSIQHLTYDPTGEIGYMMLLRYLPEILRRSQKIDSETQIEMKSLDTEIVNEIVLETNSPTSGLWK